MSSDFTLSLHQLGLPHCRGTTTLGEILRTREELSLAHKEDSAILNEALTKISEYTAASIGPVCKSCQNDGNGCALFELLTEEAAEADPKLEKATKAVKVILSLAEEPQELIVGYVLSPPNRYTQ